MRRRFLLLAVAGLLVSAVGPVPRSASASPSNPSTQNEYYSEMSTIAYEAPEWMRWLPDSIQFSELSIPATHDTMSVIPGPSQHMAETQSMALKEQLDSGIRGLDIRIIRVRGPATEVYLTITHGGVLQKAMFGPDVLQPIVDFLKAHPTETVFVKIKEDARTLPDILYPFYGEFQHEDWVEDLLGQGNLVLSPHNTGETVEQLLRRYVSSCSPDDYPGVRYYAPCTEYGGAPGTDVYGDYVYGWNGTESVGSDNPTMGELRGKIFLVDQLPSGSVPPVSPSGDMGFPSLEDPSFRVGKGANIPGYVGQWDGWAWNNHMAVYLEETDKASNEEYIFYNSLNGVSDGLLYPTPYHVAGGDRGAFTNWGQNERAFDHLLAGKQNRTGIVMMDFPGGGLIAAIIAHNFKFGTLREYAANLYDVIREVAYGFDRPAFWYTGDTSYDRGQRLHIFLKHVVREDLHVVDFKGEWDSDVEVSGPARDAKIVWGVEGLYYWVWAPRSLISQIDMTQPEFADWMNSVIDGLDGGAVDRAVALRDAAAASYPEQSWVAFVKQGPADTENWWYTDQNGGPARVDRGDWHYLLYGERRPPMNRVGLQDPTTGKWYLRHSVGQVASVPLREPR